MDLVIGWREFVARTWMAMMITVYGPTAPLAATELVVRHGETAFGFASSAGGIGMAVGGLLAMRLRPVRPLRAGALALLAFCVHPASVGLGLPVPAIAVSFAVAGSLSMMPVGQALAGPAAWLSLPRQCFSRAVREPAAV